MIITFPECRECIINQIHDIIKFNNINNTLASELLTAVQPIIDRADLTKMSAPLLTKIAHKIIREKTGINDLYGKIKNSENEKAKNIIKTLQKPQGENKLLAYLKYTIAGNVIDYGTLARFDIHDTLKNIDEHPFDLKNFNYLKEVLSKPKKSFISAITAVKYFSISSL